MIADRHRNLAHTLPVFKIEKFVADHSHEAQHHLSASDAENLTVDELLSFADGSARDQFLGLTLGYSEIRGATDLRETIAQSYRQQTADTIMGFAGAGETIFALFNVLFKDGDHAITVTPNYQSHEALPNVLGRVTCIELDPDQNWSLDLNAVEDAIEPATKAVIINYPHNPTGTILPEDELTALIGICQQHGLYLINDEVFSQLGPSTTMHPPAVADLYEKGISINVLSKAYGLPGLRIGWVATQDRDLLERLELFKHYLSVCMSTCSEFLAEIAIRHRDSIFARNRGIVDGNIQLWNRFFDTHAKVLKPAYPAGGCIAYPEYCGPGTVDDMAKALRERHGVFVVPASVFASQETGTPSQHFRVGFGRRGLSSALQAFDRALSDLSGP